MMEETGKKSVRWAYYPDLGHFKLTAYQMKDDKGNTFWEGVIRSPTFKTKYGTDFYENDSLDAIAGGLYGSSKEHTFRGLDSLLSSMLEEEWKFMWTKKFQNTIIEKIKEKKGKLKKVI
jgi:hypothetical protein